MRKVIRPCFFIANLILLSLFTFVLSASLPARSAFAQKTAPDFTLKDPSGKEVSLSSFRGKVVILNFWATWCPACKDEMPRFEKLYSEMKGRGVEVIAVSSDYSVGSLKEYLAKNKFSFTILYDDQRIASRLYRISYLPVTVLIDKKGTIVEKIAGEFDWPSQELKQKIERLLR